MQIIHDYEILDIGFLSYTILSVGLANIWARDHTETVVPMLFGHGFGIPASNIPPPPPPQEKERGSIRL